MDEILLLPYSLNMILKGFMVFFLNRMSSFLSSFCI